MVVTDTTPCIGPHDLGWDSRRHTQRCKNCGIPAQEITFGQREDRGLIAGEFRVVCRGPAEDDEDTACPIGPSPPTPHIKTAQTYLVEHQEAATEADDCLHAVKIVQLNVDEADA